MVDLRPARTAVTSADKELLTVTVTAEGSLLLNGDPVTLPALPAALQGRRVGLADPLVSGSFKRRESES